LKQLPESLGYIQFDVQQGRWADNLTSVKMGLDDLCPVKGTLVVLPELWGAGFDYVNLARHAKKTPDLLGELQNEAGKRGIYLAGSLPEAVERDGDGIFCNTLYFLDGSGVVGKYRKQHLFAPMKHIKIT